MVDPIPDIIHGECFSTKNQYNTSHEMKTKGFNANKRSLQNISTVFVRCFAIELYASNYVSFVFVIKNFA